MFKKIAAAVFVVGLSVGNAMAAVPADVTTAIEAAKTDGTTVAVAMLVLAAAFLGFHIIRRQMK